MGFSSARNLGRDISAGFSPPRRMPISEAVKKFMRVPKGAGNSVPWDPELTPYIIEPMNCLASREYDAVIFVGPARTGKTIGLIDGWIVYTIVCDPSDMLVVQMTEDKAREHSKKRLDRTFRSSAAVKKRMSPRRNDNNVHDKTFRDGSFLKIGWPSVNIMSSSDYRFVALTDYDRFPENIDSEGDGFSLASKRTTTFMSAGMTLVESSPGRDICDSKWRRKSPHEAPPTTGILSLYNRGDRRRWYWPCPHCGEYFQPAMDAMTGYRNEPDPFKASEAAYLLCPHCSGIITAEKKRELNSAGVWLREGQVIDRNGNVSGEPRRSRIASFWMEGPAAAYQTWAQLVYKLLTAEQEYEATGSEETLRAVINTDWGLPYLPRASMEQRKSELLEQRAEPVPSRSVPDGVNFLVATVDVQAGRHRRFVVQVAASINIRPGHDYYFYVRSVNTVGKSAFVEAVGQPSDDASGYLDFFKGEIGKTHLAQELWTQIDNGQLAPDLAEIRTSITDVSNEITQTVNKKLEDQSAAIQQIQKVQVDTNNNLNSMWAVKLQQMKDGRLYIAGIGAGIENTPAGMQSQVLLAADRIAMINPANGNTKPMFVGQGDQIFMNDVFLKRLTAPTITSGGNPPAFSLTPDGKLTAKNADISGNVNANSGTLNNVTINENCQIKGKLSANQIEGDIVKTVSKSFPRTNSYASGTITVRISDDQKFDRQVMIPPVLFRGGKHENFNSNNQQSYWYSTCRLRVTRNGQEIFNQSTTDAQGVFSSVIDMPAGQGTLTLTFTVSSSGANNWTPTTSISDLLVVVMKKSTAGISIS
ncbi:TPA: terminase gpA endonuclease subunit [Escherichia coli]|uniref:terminase gpA endonuclease subunit n=1 Tax=Escherichia coli TaxID=562 RepID=UPI0034E2BC40